MLVNNKVRNATPLEYDGITFKSKLEVTTYKALKEAGYNPEYEKHTYTLQKSSLFSIPCYTPYKDRKIHKEVWGLNKYKTIGMKYTPDFRFEIDGTEVFVEVKGYQNDRYPYQKKLFLKWLEDNNHKSIFFEIHNNKQLKQALEILKEWKEKV